MSEGKRRSTDWQEAALCHLDALYGFAMALTWKPDEAEDLVQETYMQAMQHFAQLRPDSNLKAWLFIIMRNAWLKQLRHRRSGPDFVDFDHNDVMQQTVETDDPQSLYIRIWEREEIRVALAQLPSHCQEIIVLRDIEGFSYKEMAKILDCPVGTIMSRLARARTQLKRALSAEQAPVQKKRNNG